MGYMEFSDSKIVKTRKNHTCVFCEREFPPGTTMEHECGKYEGDFFSRYTCPDCREYTPGFWEWCDYECGDYYCDFANYIREIGAPHPAFMEEE